MTRYREIFRADQLPVLQNRMFRSRDEAVNCPKGDVILVQDQTTGLIFNRAFEPGSIRYDADYQNEQAVSAVFQQHLSEVADLVEQHLRGRTLIEVGCGKAFFLEMLQGRGFEITGLDPAYEGGNPAVRKTHFTHDTGLRADGLILRHVLEHIPDPAAFLADLRDANGGGGTIYIEVPCFDWIGAHRTWFDIFYEHVNYFRLADFQRLFGTVQEATRTFNGQYLSVVADLSSLRPARYEESDHFELPSGFMDGVLRHTERIRARRGGNHGRAAIWGGASKGVIFALYMERAGAPVDVVVDVNPAKQGKYLGGTGLEVWSDQRAMRELPPGSEILVMNDNYLEEIKERTSDAFRYVTLDIPGQ